MEKPYHGTPETRSARFFRELVARLGEEESARIARIDKMANAVHAAVVGLLELGPQEAGRVLKIVGLRLEEGGK